MASTNKTINYNLSQYTANDKPTYLSDYNSDMNKIDTQMKANNDLAGLAKTEADDLSSRVDGQDAVISAINTTIGEHTSSISTLNTEVSDINTKVGNLTDLNTTDKSNTISAINEVNTKVGNLNDLNTTDKSDIISAVNEVNTKVDEYSTGEVKTNKVWIDDKAIYRKVFYLNATSFTDGYDIDISSLDIEHLDITMASFSYQLNNLHYTFYNNYFVSAEDRFDVFRREENIRVRLGSTQIGGTSKYLTMVLEYTKKSSN